MLSKMVRISAIFPDIFELHRPANTASDAYNSSSGLQIAAEDTQSADQRLARGFLDMDEVQITTALLEQVLMEVT